MLEAGTSEWADDLLGRWRSTRNPEALGQLLKWQRNRAYATAFKILGNDSDAEDAVQQSFIKLLSRTQGFDNVSNFRIAVYRATVQCALDVARTNRVRSKLEKAMSPLERNLSPVPQLAAEQAEALKLVWQELHALPEDSRAMVVLCYQEGLSVSDAAEVLSVPRETLRDRLATSMSELRRKLSQRGVALSLLLLVTLLQHGRSEAAPAGLCEALDVSLPGPNCANVPVAQVPVATPEALLAGTSGGAAPVISLPVKIGLGLAASIAVISGVWMSMPPVSPAKNTPVALSVARPAAEVRPAKIDEPVHFPLVEDRKPAPAPATGEPRHEPAQQVVEAPAQQKGNPDLVPLDEVPAAIREAASRAVKGINLLEAEREIKPPGSYEFKGELAGKKYEILVDATGKVLKVKEDRDDDDDDNGVKRRAAVPPPAPPVDF